MTKLSQMNIPRGYVVHSLMARTAAIAAHNVRALVGAALNIPGIAGKMYTLIGFEVTNKSTLTTAVPTGGLVEVTNDAVDWVPTELLFNTSTTLGAAGGLVQTPTFIPVNKPLPAGSNVSVFYTAQNAATDYLCVTIYWSTQPYYGAQTFLRSAYGTSRTSVATFVGDVAVAIPANKGGNCIGFLAQIYGTVVTILSIGGGIAVHNNAANIAWEPFNFCTGSATCIASGGGEIPIAKIDANGDAPGNSTFTFDVTYISTNAQVTGIVVVWEA